MPEELLKKFVAWLKLKVRLDCKDEKLIPTFKTGEVWWVSIGMNIGHEQYGKHDNFERPALIIRAFNRHMFWAIPMTSQVKDTKYHMPFKYRKYSGERDTNGTLVFEEKDGNIIISQLKTMSSKRLLRKVGVVDKDILIGLRKKVRSFI